MVDGRCGAASFTSFSDSNACFGGLATIARAALMPAAPDLIKLSAHANIALSPDASSGSITASPASKPRRSSPDFKNVTSFIDPPWRLSAAALCPLGSGQATD